MSLKLFERERRCCGTDSPVKQKCPFLRGSITFAALFLVALLGVIALGLFVIRDRTVTVVLGSVVFLAGLLFFSDVPERLRKASSSSKKAKERALALERKKVRTVMRRISRLKRSQFSCSEAYLEAARLLVPSDLAGNRELRAFLGSLEGKG